jgi:hypothetical protein
VSGYVASARILAGTPRMIRREALAPAIEPVPHGAAAVTVELVPSPWSLEPAIGLSERLSRVRDRWAQLTFFLTDPDSWR